MARTDRAYRKMMRRKTMLCAEKDYRDILLRDCQEQARKKRTLTAHSLCGSCIPRIPIGSRRRKPVRSCSTAAWRNSMPTWHLFVSRPPLGQLRLSRRILPVQSERRRSCSSCKRSMRSFEISIAADYSRRSVPS